MCKLELRTTRGVLKLLTCVYYGASHHQEDRIRKVMKSELQRRRLNIQNSPFAQLQFLSPIIMVSSHDNYYLCLCYDKEIDLSQETKKKECLLSKAHPPS